LTLTFQLEVAKRICAPIETDERTRISIVSQHICKPTLEFVIPGWSFNAREDNPFFRTMFCAKSGSQRWCGEVRAA
jgi:hypothetical protein